MHVGVGVWPADTISTSSQTVELDRVPYLEVHGVVIIVISGVISRRISVITTVTLLITPLVTTMNLQVVESRARGNGSAIDGRSPDRAHSYDFSPAGATCFVWVIN